MKKYRYQWILSAAFLLFYTLVYLIWRDSVSAFGYFEAAGTLLLFSVTLFWLGRVYYTGLVVFACIAQFGGVMLRLYDIIPTYDIFLHLASGVLLTLLGHYLCTLMIRHHPESVVPRPLVLCFSGLFALASAGVWEIYEFAADQLFGLDCQLGSLTDTMTDIIAGSCGALAGLLLVWLLLRRNPSGK